MAFIPLCYDILLGCGVYLDSFSSTSFSEMLYLMLAYKLSSPIDTLPIFLFHKLAFILTPFILNSITISLDSGIVPSSLKHAIIKPILKKPGLDIECLYNYRPISQLPLISKILERIVSKHLINYLKANSLFDTRQSGYRKFHSLETLLLSIIDDFLYKLDNNSNIQLILLYLSAAFDTIDHSILIKRLEYIGIVDILLAWIKSYLSERTFSSKIDNIIHLIVKLIMEYLNVLYYGHCYFLCISYS